MDNLTIAELESLKDSIIAGNIEIARSREKKMDRIAAEYISDILVSLNSLMRYLNQRIDAITEEHHEEMQLASRRNP